MQFSNNRNDISLITTSSGSLMSASAFAKHSRDVNQERLLEIPV